MCLQFLGLVNCTSIIKAKEINIYTSYLCTFGVLHLAFPQRSDWTFVCHYEALVAE